MSNLVAVVNIGTSSLKVALLQVDEKTVRELQRLEYEWLNDSDVPRLLHTALDSLHSLPDAFGHRIVHGGSKFIEPTILSVDIESELQKLVPLAPLHNEAALVIIGETRKRFPQIPAVAVFDTAFHAHRPAVSMRYALPQEMVDEFELQRYGFHGIAHAALANAYASALEKPIDDISAVTLQLGGGSSACAIRSGRSVETSMGFTPLEGLVMTTRCGDVDPAIPLHLIRAGYSADRIEPELTCRSGLYALCGLTDMREILTAAECGQANAQLALDHYCHRIILTIGGYFTLLDGEGALVFGGGIGTNAPKVRARIAAGLTTWDVLLDADLNRRNQAGCISVAGTRPVYVLETDEERIIASAVNRRLFVLNSSRGD